MTDDGSTDASLDVLNRIARFDARVRVFALSHSGLPAVGRNFAMRQAHGQYLAFLDSDDLFAPDKLQKQLQVLQEDSSLGLTYSWAEEFWSDPLLHDKPAPVIWRRFVLPQRAFSTLLSEGNVVCTSSILMRRSVWERIGDFNEIPALRGMEDHDFILRVAKHYNIKRTEGFLVQYRLHGTNVSKRNNFEQFHALKMLLQQRNELVGKGGRDFLSGYFMARAEQGLAGAIVNHSIRVDFIKALAINPMLWKRWFLLPLLILPRALMFRAYVLMKRIQARIEGDAAKPHLFVLKKDSSQK